MAEQEREFQEHKEAWCYSRDGGSHHAEIVPGRSATFLYASHPGAWWHSCAKHSGMCHELCWSAVVYPMLRPRTLAGYEKGLKIP